MMVKQKIQWMKSIDEKQDSELTRGEKVTSALATSLLCVVYALIFACAAIIAVANVYEFKRPSVTWFLGLIFLVFATSFIMEFAEKLKRKWAKLVPAGTLIFGIMCLSSCFWGVKRAQNLYGGIIAFIRMYIRDWNTKYDAGIRWYTGKEAYAEDGAYFLILLIFFLVFWVAKLVKKNQLMMLVPIGIILAEVMVGKAPGRWPIFLLISGLLLYSNMAWDKPDMQSTSWKRRDDGTQSYFFQWIGTSMLMSVICGTLLIVGVGSAQNLIDRNAAKVTTDVAKITENLPDWEDWNNIKAPEELVSLLERMFKGEELDYQELSNNSPKFEQIAVLEVEVSQKPLENIYLKDFCGDIYESNMWERGNERLIEACEKMGISYESIKKNVTYLTINKVAQQYRAESLAQVGMTRDMNISYVGLSTSEVYAPYFAEAGTEGIYLESDGCFAKDESLETVSFIQWNEENYDFTDIAGAKAAWESDYEKFVADYYLEVPEHLVEVREIAREIAESLDDSTMSIGVELNSEMRLFKANLVAAWMNENTNYSLELPAITGDTDPIDYFLGTTRMGYCMHYASASVMILRELGVPARYVSGYIVPADDFVASGNGYTATVLDARAHAWVEIYLNEIGWVPVEVTKSYPSIQTTEALLENMPVTHVVTGEISGTIEVSTESSGEPGQSEQTGEIGVVENSEMTGSSEEDGESGDAEFSEESTENEMTEVSEDESASEMDENIDNEDGSEEESVSESRFTVIQPDPDEADVDGESENVLITVAYVMAGIVFIGVVIALTTNTHKFFRSESVYYKKLKRQMKKGNHKNAILDINSAIYRKLEFKKLLEPGSSDEVYENVLKSNYKDYSAEEWEKYMNIVKAANFSERDFTQEELKFCFDVYRDVIYKDEVW